MLFEMQNTVFVLCLLGFAFEINEIVTMTKSFLQCISSNSRVQMILIDDN